MTELIDDLWVKAPEEKSDPNGKNRKSVVVVLVVVVIRSREGTSTRSTGKTLMNSRKKSRFVES